MSKLFTARLLILATLIIAVASTAIGATFAFLSDLETSPGNSFDAGVLDLKIDNTSYYNGAASPNTTWTLDDLTGHLFFNFLDVKPGDWGEDTISIHVVNNDAWACLDSESTSDDDNLTNELELEAGDIADTGSLTDGELGSAINFAFWVDDGDNVLETGEQVFTQGNANQVLGNLNTTLSDSISNLFGPTGTPLLGAQTYYIAKAWCFGTLGLAPLPQDGQGANSPRTPANSTGGVTCDGSALGNITQSDKFTADIQFSAIQHRDNLDFVCDPTITPSPTPSNTPTPTPTPPTFACTSVDNIFATSASDNDQGLQKSGASVLANRSVASAAFGVPQTAGLPSDVGVPVGSFFSLGFPLGGNTASIVYGFSEPFFNGPGADFQIYEVTGGVYPDELVKVEVSDSATGPWTTVAAAAVRDASIDINPLTQAQFIKLTDVSNIALFPNDGDGYDLDAIRAFCTSTNN